MKYLVIIKSQAREVTQEVRTCWPEFDPQNLYDRREPPDLCSASRTHMKSQRWWHVTVIPALLH